LASRGVALREGDEDDDSDRETVCGLGNRKNRFFREWLGSNRVEAFLDAMDFLRRLREAGVATAVISSSRNCAAILKSAGVEDLFAVALDGRDSARLDLPGKPDPAIFREAADRLGADRGRSVAVEDSKAGIQAAAGAGFAFVVGVVRDDDDAAYTLRASGADVVVSDLRRLLPRDGATADNEPDALSRLPSPWDGQAGIRERLGRCRPAVFLDYDGTLTPIVEDHRDANLAKDMRRAVAELAERCPVAIVTGRDLEDIRRRVGLDSLVYAGSHGFDIAGPGDREQTPRKGKKFLPALDAAERALRERVAGIAGAEIERKRFSIATHYRRVHAKDVAAVEDAVDAVVETQPCLCKSRGKKVFQVQPNADWDKGEAVLWLLDRLQLEGSETLPIYVGDDVTDEDAFRALRQRGGLAVVVRGNAERRETAAELALKDVAEVRRFLEELSAGIAAEEAR